MIYWFLLATLLMLSGCAETPLPPFMLPGAETSIQIGRSTMADVQQAFGRPQRMRTVQELGSTVTIWRYQHVEQGTYELIPALRESLSKPAKLTIVDVHFGDDKVVRKIDRTYQEIHSPEEGGILVPF